MDVLSYETILNMLNNFITDKCHIEKEVIDQDKAKLILEELFGKYYNKDGNIENAKIIYTNYFKLLKYEQNNGKKTKVLAVVKDDIPIYKIESYETNCNNMGYKKVRYSVYDSDINHLEYKMDLEEWKDGRVVVSKVDMLEKNRVVLREYVRDSFEIYSYDGEIKSIKHKDEMLMSNEVGFTQKKVMFDNRFKRINGMIETKLDDIIKNTETKEYVIKRKFPNE